MGSAEGPGSCPLVQGPNLCQGAAKDLTCCKGGLADTDFSSKIQQKLGIHLACQMSKFWHAKNKPSSRYGK